MALRGHFLNKYDKLHQLNVIRFSFRVSTKVNTGNIYSYPTRTITERPACYIPVAIITFPAEPGKSYQNLFDATL